jgi:hypothetical protein
MEGWLVLLGLLATVIRGLDKLVDPGGEDDGLSL